MSNNGQQQQQPTTTIYTIQEGSASQVNQQRQHQDQSDILIDTSSIPTVSQQQMPPMHHHHQQLQPTTASMNQNSNQANQSSSTNFDTITSQPSGSGAGGGGSSGARVAPEQQNVVYSVHPVFSLLDNQDALLIRQRADCTSTCCGFESQNTYTVRSKEGAPLLKAVENSNCCERCCFEGNREYDLSLVSGDEVVARIRKGYHLSRFCCYSNSVRIESPEENPIGEIRQLFTLFGHSRYAIYDSQQPPKRPSFIIESSSCRFCCTPLLCICICVNKEFRVVNVETREQVGTISRHWPSGSDEPHQAQLEAGSPDQANGQHDPGDDQEQHQQQQQAMDQPFGSPHEMDGQLFGVEFAPDLEARHKVLLLSACFMMDFFYFENDRRRRKLASC